MAVLVELPVPCRKQPRRSKRERGGGTLVCSSPPRRRRPGHTHTGAHTAAAAPALLIAVAPPRGSVRTSVHRHPPSATHHRGVPVHHTAHHHRERAERCAVLPAYGGHSRRRLAFARVWIVGWAAEARCRIRARRGSERHPRGASDDRGRLHSAAHADHTPPACFRDPAGVESSVASESAQCDVFERERERRRGRAAAAPPASASAPPPTTDAGRASSRSVTSRARPPSRPSTSASP